MLYKNIIQRLRKLCVNFCGTPAEAGETVSVPVIKGCGLHLECKIVEQYTMAEDKFDKELGEKWYANKDWHTCYTGVITAAYVEE